MANLAAVTKRERVERKAGLLGAGEPPGGRRVVVALHHFSIYIDHRRELELLLSDNIMY